MNQEKENMEDFFSFRNKLKEFDNEVKESILELSNIHKQCKKKRKMTTERLRSKTTSYSL